MVKIHHCWFVRFRGSMALQPAPPDSEFGGTLYYYNYPTPLKYLYSYIKYYWYIKILPLSAVHCCCMFIFSSANLMTWQIWWCHCIWVQTVNQSDVILHNIDIGCADFRSTCMIFIDIEVSRFAIGIQSVCIIRLPQCTITTLNFASRVAHLLAAYYWNRIFTSLVKPTSWPISQPVC